MEDTPDLSPGALGREGSTPSFGTRLCFRGETGHHVALRRLNWRFKSSREYQL